MAELPPAVHGMLAAGSAWFWTTDAEHRFTGLSEHVKRVIGVDPGAFLGRSRMDFIVGLTAYTPEGESHIRCLNAHEPFRDFTYRHVFADEKDAWISTSGDPVFDVDGRFVGYRGIGVLLSGAVEQASNSMHSELDLFARASELQRKVEARTDALDRSYRMLSEVLQCMDQGLLV